jgi:hypothetical protein
MSHSALRYLTNKLVKATMLSKTEPLVAKVVSVSERLFDGDTIPTMILVIDHEDMGVALNQTRLWTMIEAFGEDYANWVGQTIRLHQGLAQYGGQMVPAIILTPVVRDRIGGGGGGQEPRRSPDLIEKEAEVEAGVEPDYGEAEDERDLADVLSDEIPF